MRKIAFIGLVTLLLPFLSVSQVLDPVKWTFRSERTTQDEVTLLLVAKIDKGWHLYSQHLPAGGPLPTVFTFTASDNYKLVGEVTEPDGVEEYDPNFEIELKFFDGTVVFKQKVKILTDKAFTITGVLSFMCCDDKRCLPPTDIDFEFPLKAFTTGATAQQPELPVAVVETKETQPDTSSITAVATITGTESAGALAVTEETSTESSSMWVFFLVALLAGFAGALTPCVYPMIPMTVTFFMSSSNSKLGAKVNALFYGLSIIVIYTLIGVLVTLLFGSDAIKNVSSSWITNIIFFLLFVTFAASFFGLFEIVLPSKLTNKSDQQVDRGGLIGTFFMALTLVLVSFSCTAPFIGGILVEASSGNILKPTIGMFGFSLAFALPFTILAFFPSLLG